MNSRQSAPLREIQRNLAFPDDSFDNKKAGFDGTDSPLSLLSEPDFSGLAAPPTMSTADLLNASMETDLSIPGSALAHNSPSDIWQFSEIKKPAPETSFSLQNPKPQEPIQASTPSFLHSAPKSSKVTEKAPKQTSHVSSTIGEAVTPVATMTPENQSAYSASFSSNLRASSWTDLLIWRDFVKTLIVAVAGSFLLAFATYLGVGNHGFTLLSSASIFGLALVCFHFLGSLFNPHHKKWATLDRPSNAEAVAEAAASLVKKAAHLHDCLMLSDQPRTMLWVALSLWGMMTLGGILSFWAILWSAYVAIFTIPAAWHYHGQVAKQHASLALDAARKKAADLGITRGVAALIQTLVLACVFVNLPLPHRFAVVIVGTVAARCQLNPEEVESIRAKAEEITMSVQKQPAVSRFLAAYTPHRKMM